MKVRISGPARKDLAAHWDFMLLAYDEVYAQKTLDLINAAVAFLGQQPNAGQFEVELASLGKGHRRWVVGHYKLVYLTVQDQLIITQIFDTRQDPAKMKG